MSRFHKLSHVVWHCQYHIVFVPKYRYRILRGAIGQAVEGCIRLFSDQLGCLIVELNVQPDHIHLLVKLPPKVSVSKYMGTIKGRTAIRVFKQFSHLKQQPYWGNRLWARGYCVDTVGLDPEMIIKYVRYQADRDQSVERQGRLI